MRLWIYFISFILTGTWGTILWEIHPVQRFEALCHTHTLHTFFFLFFLELLVALVTVLARTRCFTQFFSWYKLRAETFLFHL